MRTSLTTFAAFAAIGLTAGSAVAQEVTLRMHHFMPGPATLSVHLVTPWVEEVEAASDGRLKIEVFEAMSLGGAPGDLFDQVADGAVDMILTLPGYTPGRFPRAEVFELPFMMEDAEATSKAFWDLIDGELQDGEMEDAKILAAWVHGPGQIYSEEPIATLEDMAGKEMRGPTRVTTDLLGELGATPVGMPLPAIPENLSKGVINGTVLPWEITPAIKLGELVGNHTALSGDQALYTAVFIMAINWDSYDALPDDLKAILDESTGKVLSGTAGRVMVEADARGQAVWTNLGNNSITLDEAEVERWKQAAQPVYDRWIDAATGQGFDGQAAIDDARALIAANQ